ncbi:MAG: helix-turn-helix transcriptional regulator [Nitrospirae bacterium]|nr:helix-turn-helix transcriptional regulator [Nitrospirota bacterium]
MSETVGDRIKAERIKTGWNQTKLAEIAGVRPSTISQIENGDRYPSTEVLEKLAKALKTTVSRLLGQTSKDELEDILQDPDVQLLFRDFKNLSAKDREMILRQIKFLKSERK